MTTLNLLYPDQSDIPFRSLTFPDGQPHIVLDAATIAALPKAGPVRILTRLASPADLMLVLFAKDALDYLGLERVELHISYLLAARMDRVMTGGEPFSLKVVARMLNAGEFRKVRIFDPHSEVATALVDRSYPVTNHAFVGDALAHYFSGYSAPKYCLVSPDGGALKKIHKLAQELGIEHVVECMKQRDVKSGKLLSFETTATDLSGQTCFIVDDICDGGGTFTGTAKVLREKGAEKIVLIVSHGIFSKGTALEGVDAIYCTDSYRPVEDGVVCLPVGRYL